MFYMPRRVAKTDCFIMHFLYEGTPGAALHHQGGNIARSEYTVMDGRRGMHHERFIETRHIQRSGGAISCMKHRSRPRLHLDALCHTPLIKRLLFRYAWVVLNRKRI